MTSQFPAGFDDFVGLAERSVEQFWQTQSTNDLFAAVLATVHIADWYFRDIERCAFDEKAKRAFAKTYADWDTLRQLGNGAKHALKRVEQVGARSVEWENVDTWDHLGREIEYWAISHAGDTRSVYSLCRGFINAIRQDVANARAAAGP